MNRSIETVNTCIAYKAKHGHYLPPKDDQEHIEIIQAFRDVHDALRQQQGHRVRFAEFTKVAFYDNNV